MKFFHLADLHIGKTVHGVSMLEDQKFILDEICSLAEKEKPDAVLICGDIYDKPAASAGAVALLDDFLTRLAGTGAEIMIISGNHDSGERVGFGSDLLVKSGVHIAGVYTGATKQVTLSDEYGEVTFTLLPFIKPSFVKAVYPDDDTSDYNAAIKTAVSKIPLNPEKRNVILSHQFLTGSVTSDSEEHSVGGLDNVDASIFDEFDYVAMGHIHRPQKLLRETLRYSGSPLKYSFSESPYDKWIPFVKMGEKGNIEIEKLPLHPLRDMKVIKGEYSTLMSQEYRSTVGKDDYIKAILTDEDEIPGAVGRLRTAYPNILSLQYENSRTATVGATLTETEKNLEMLPIELFSKLFSEQNGKAPEEEQKEYVKKLIEEIWDGEV